MVAEKIETLVVFMEGKKKIETTWCPGWAFGPPPHNFCELPPKIQTIINETRSQKKKYERFTMKSDIGDILAQFGSLFAIEYVYVIM